jgi:putative Ca2+/H+ antiporter (TMEM165/GDT1 family)
VPALAQEGTEGMDWKLALSAFGVIFLAELGDKTQIAVLTLSASSRNPLSVFLGASVGFAAVCAIGVAIGAGLGEILPLGVLRKAGAVAFIAVGAAMLFDWL